MRGERVSARRSRSRAVVSIVAIVVAVGLIAGAATAFWLNRSLSNIRKVEVTISEGQRPVQQERTGTTILLLGADAGSARGGDGTSILDDAASASWPRGKYRSDATMVLHIDQEREAAYVVSIPRDSYVPVYDDSGEERESTKINAALSLYGPSGAIATVEKLTGVRIDHLAMVDWDGFEAITDAVGGVELSVPGEGARRYDGAEALEYVRVRKTLPNGDFDRVERQQNFLRAVARGTNQARIWRNPVRLKRTLDAVTRNLAVDDAWSDGDIRSLALDLRGLKPADIVFVTVPTTGTAEDPVAGSIVTIDEPAADELFSAMREDQMAAWVDLNADAPLGPPGTID